MWRKAIGESQMPDALPVHFEKIPPQPDPIVSVCVYLRESETQKEKT